MAAAQPCGSSTSLGSMLGPQSWKWGSAGPPCAHYSYRNLDTSGVLPCGLLRHWQVTSALVAPRPCWLRCREQLRVVCMGRPSWRGTPCFPEERSGLQAHGCGCGVCSRLAEPIYLFFPCVNFLQVSDLSCPWKEPVCSWQRGWGGTEAQAGGAGRGGRGPVLWGGGLAQDKPHALVPFKGPFSFCAFSCALLPPPMCQLWC